MSTTYGLQNFIYDFMRLLGQAVKTSPFHGGNTGSIPVGVINSQNAAVIVTDAFLVVKRFTE